MSDTVLICHALPDRDIGRLLEDLLEAAGLDAMIGPAPDADKATDGAAGESLASVKVAFIIIGADTASPAFRSEVAHLLARVAAEPEFRLVPLLLPGTPPDDAKEYLNGLAGIQAIDLRLDGGIIDLLGKLAAAMPLLGPIFLRATRHRPDLVAGLLAGLAKRWQALRQDDRAEHLFELAAELLERATTPRDEPKAPSKGDANLLAAIAALGREVLDAVANAPAADEVAALARKALAVRLGTWAAEMLERGNSAGARRAFERVLPLAKSAFGDDSKTTLEIAAGLARSLRGLGELAQAQAIEEDTLIRLRSRAGNADAATLALAGNLAATLAARGRLSDARALQESVLATRRRELGDAHPESLTARSNLAVTLHAQGDYAGAREQREAVLDGRRTLFGAGYPDTLAAAWNLLVTCLAMNDTAGASKLVETDLVPLFTADISALPADLARIRARLVHPPADLTDGGKEPGAGG